MTIPDIGHDLEIYDISSCDNLPGMWITGRMGGYYFRAISFCGYEGNHHHEIGKGRFSLLKIYADPGHCVLLVGFDLIWHRRPPADSEAAEIVAFLETGLVDYVLGEVG